MMQHHWKIVERAPGDGFEAAQPPGGPTTFRHIADVLAGLEEVRTALGAARRHPDAVRLDGVE